MREYNYSDIVKVDKTGILFSDTMFVSFEECRCEWAKENNLPIADTVCVAMRFPEGDEKHFIFYTREKVKLLFKFQGFFKQKKSIDKFCEMQIALNRYGYTSYDAS